METKLADVWGQVEQYLPQSLSIIPVRDRDDEYGVAKSSYGKWTYNQTNCFTAKQLWDALEKNNTTAVGIVCGSVSGNLEVIDIDSKYMPGIDAILFNDLQKFYPDVYAELRLHKTPSGGYHILYRIADRQPEGNLKLAARIPTEFEVQEFQRKNPLTKKKLTHINFLETRGEKGYIVAPPSLGYSVHTDVPIPVITWEQRCSLIELCRTYNKYYKELPPEKPPVKDETVYDVNPFADFNARVDPTELVGSHGWKFAKENHHFIWYTRPGKEKGVSISWNKEKRVFFSFSSSTDLESDRGYNASTFLKIYQFNNDGKATYKYLIDNGYGKLKPKFEQSIIEKAKIKGAAHVPGNLSEQAAQSLAEELEHAKLQYPHGMFWTLNSKDKIEISRERLYIVADGLGLMQYKDEPVHVKENIVYKLTDNDFYNVLKEYITEDDFDLYEQISNEFESFIEHHGKFTITRLPILDRANILLDDNETCYQCYQNGLLRITASNIELLPYGANTKLIWADKLISRNWVPEYNKELVEGCKYAEYLQHAIGLDESLMRIIGYLCHDYKDETTGWLIICTERCPDPKQGGGSGKNLFGLLLKNITKLYALPGEQIALDEKLLQSWNYERVIMINDLPKKFNLAWFKDISTGYVTRKRLFKNVETISPEDMGKFLLNTNHSFEVTDGGLKRRIIPIEFTDFFTRCGGVNKHFGGYFPTATARKSIWKDDDWTGYDWMISQSVQLYLQDGDLHAQQLSTGGWEKQFKQQFGQHTFEFIQDNFSEWTERGFTETHVFNQEYKNFCIDNNLREGLSGITMNNALRAFSERADYAFDGNKLNSITKKKGKYFEKVVKNE